MSFAKRAGNKMWILRFSNASTSDICRPLEFDDHRHPTSTIVNHFDLLVQYWSRENTDMIYGNFSVTPNVHLEIYLPVRKIGGTRVLVPGHQNSGAPTFFFGVFLMVFSHLCWQCSDKTRKCQEHIDTLRKKEKLIFLKPILEIKTKNLFST